MKKGAKMRLFGFQVTSLRNGSIAPKVFCQNPFRKQSTDTRSDNG